MRKIYMYIYECATATVYASRIMSERTDGMYMLVVDKVAKFPFPLPPSIVQNIQKNRPTNWALSGRTRFTTTATN